MYAGRWLPALLPFSFLLALCFVTSPGSIPMDMKTSPLTLLNDPTPVSYTHLTLPTIYSV